MVSQVRGAIAFGRISFHQKKLYHAALEHSSIAHRASDIKQHDIQAIATVSDQTGDLYFFGLDGFPPGGRQLADFFDQRGVHFRGLQRISQLARGAQHRGNGRRLGRANLESLRDTHIHGSVLASDRFLQRRLRSSRTPDVRSGRVAAIPQRRNRSDLMP